LALEVISLNGCVLFKDIIENTSRTFTKPTKVHEKIKDPIRDDVRLSALWIGHATFLLQIDDKVILTDPFLTNNISLFYKRVVEPGIDINDLKMCDIILISHSHFDHCNLGSLGILEDKFPKTNLVFPEGVEEFLPDLDFKFHKLKRADVNDNIYIGETRVIDSVKITSVAAYHWGGRYGLDGLIWGYNGYAGFIIEYHGLTVYYSGDTGYDDKFFKFLGEKYKIDLALIPIGPCTDCSGIDKKDRHVYPEGTLKILDDTKASLLIPFHFGTISELSKPNFPKNILQELVNKNNKYKEKVKILEIGEQVIIE
jgi:N-acyl-phosphatidylethanolamine-hydrolysing phospholipase D